MPIIALIGGAGFAVCRPLSTNASMDYWIVLTFGMRVCGSSSM